MGECDHVWHSDPGLITPCPCCGEGDDPVLAIREQAMGILDVLEKSSKVELAPGDRALRAVLVETFVAFGVDCYCNGSGEEPKSIYDLDAQLERLGDTHGR